mmetsp:Transcript_19571/g.31105  ORF Transcript_19571/g.31105 Transcript_19571/m.31105 type:complete len:262 (-) Transcript_19571:70-855(-)
MRRHAGHHTRRVQQRVVLLRRPPALLPSALLNRVPNLGGGMRVILHSLRLIATATATKTVMMVTIVRMCIAIVTAAAEIHQSRLHQRRLNHNLLHVDKHFLNAIRIRSARQMRKNVLPIRLIIERRKRAPNIFRRLIERSGGALKILQRLALGDRHPLNLVLEDVLLVEEQNHRGLAQRRIVAHVVKQLELIRHRVGAVVLVEHFVVARQTRDENHRNHVLKTVNPFSALRSLSTNIDDMNHFFLHDKLLFAEIGGHHATH